MFEVNSFHSVGKNFRLPSGNLSIRKLTAEIACLVISYDISFDVILPHGEPQVICVRLIESALHVH